MRKAALVVTTAGALVLTGVATLRPAEARYGFGPAFAGGLIAGAVIGGLAAPAYAWGPGYPYYGPYGYYGSYDRGYNGAGCPARGYGQYYNCGAYFNPGYGGR